MIIIRATNMGTINDYIYDKKQENVININAQ